MYESVSLSDAEDMLRFISPDLDRDEWFSVAGALKTEFGDAGQTPFDSWSQDGRSYDKGACASTWRSAKPGHYTIGTLVKMAKEGGWQPPDREALSPADLKRLRAEQEERRRQRQAEVEADEAKRNRLQVAVSEACTTIWNEHTRGLGSSPYLGKKGVGAHGIRFFSRSLLLVIDDQAETVRILTGADVKRFFADLPKPRPDHLSFLKFGPGAVAVPMRDVEGRIWAIQTINHQGTKLFPKYARKKGSFHLLGDLEGAQLVGFAEGYATASTCFEVGAGWPVVVCFDKGNMASVAEALLTGWEGVTPIWLADNDPPDEKTGKPAGLTAAQKCQSRFGGAILMPRFPGEAA